MLDIGFEKGFARKRSEQTELLGHGRRNHKGTLDFSSYCNANQKRFLGFQGSLFLGRSFGNDSSNAIGCLNQAGYWKLNYYKGEAMARALKDFDEGRDALKKRAASMDGGPPMELKKSDSMAELGGGMFKIANSMREEVLKSNAPPGVKDTGKLLSFHNVLGDKYYANGCYKGGHGTDKNAKNYVYDKTAHTSSKAELDFILGGYFRTDKDLIMKREEALKRRNSIISGFGNYLTMSSPNLHATTKGGSSEE